jgi:excisionase family DNA binding protein
MTRNTITISTAVKILGCSRSFIYRLAREGKIEHLRLGERQGIKFYRDSVLAYLESHQWQNRYLEGQGGQAVKMTIASDALATAGMIPRDERQPLNVDQAVNLLLACCAPIPEQAVSFVNERAMLVPEGGYKTLHGVLVDCLADEHRCPACVRVLQQKPFVAIHGTDDDDVLEFETAYSSGGFRVESVISGGMLSLLAMHTKTQMSR